MRWLWYAAQTLFIGWMTYVVWQKDPTMPPGHLLITFGLWVCLCAFLTACLTRLWDWGVQRLRALRRHGGQSSGDSLRLTGTGRGLGEATEHRKRIRVRD